MRTEQEIRNRIKECKHRLETMDIDDFHYKMVEQTINLSIIEALEWVLREEIEMCTFLRELMQKSNKKDIK